MTKRAQGKQRRCKPGWPLPRAIQAGWLQMLLTMANPVLGLPLGRPHAPWCGGPAAQLHRGLGRPARLLAQARLPCPTQRCGSP